MMISKIISGGQTGADRGGLEAGKALGIETGGFAPRGWRTELGADPSLADLGLVEAKTNKWSERTRLNVMESDGTVMFGNSGSPGSRLAMNLCLIENKPYKVNPTVDELRAWIIKHNIHVLNVAGNRESKNPGIGERVKTFLMAALSEYVCER